MTKTTAKQEDLVTQFIDAAIEVHRELGPGYDEAVYENALVVELKAVEQLNPKHMAQVISYLKTVKKPLGLLVNFHESLLKKGLKRIIYS